MFPGLGQWQGRRWLWLAGALVLVALVAGYVAYRQVSATGGTLSGTPLGDQPAPGF